MAVDLETIEALLRKAMSTDSQEEAETFFAGAARLMAKHGITEAELNLARDVRELPGHERWAYSPNAYWLPGKRELLLAACEIAGSGTRYLYYAGNQRRGPQECEVFGYAKEREIAKSAYASLYIQGRAAASRGGWKSTKEVSSFLIGFAHGVIYKVIDVRTTEEAKVSESTALALRDRSEEVADLYNEQDAKPAPKVSTDWFASQAGREAGLDADIGLSSLEA